MDIIMLAMLGFTVGLVVGSLLRLLWEVYR